jgi:hypothetical protein
MKKRQLKKKLRKARIPLPKLRELMATWEVWSDMDVYIHPDFEKDMIDQIIIDIQENQ